MRLSPLLLAAAISLSPFALFAATVHRCEDHHGHITFTHLGCPGDQQLLLQTADNPLPGTVPPAVKTPEKTANKGIANKPLYSISGTAERQDGCGNQVTASARRKAMINKEVRSGMTRADVESMLGKPDAISSQNGKVRYSYVDKQSGRKRSVSFDGDDCVKP
ncbi:outer membrane protein assembly factor BamE domain-containing protein [Pseudomonas turukhanskensis]|uniref:Outer membrane protein assembly factor BamE domain-containing protein n=1 Tax=Pseudomonas turukhanskensis TaxID=1806536 RepID=A0A9W6K829_9PSED|nr:outer membrane protein assembly factor BamE [Pseudomonas turukhanskensis]GLK89420.1 hypothetical protein GCM10017655_24820 [Pseudomonas turukhanskensis]